MQGMVKVKNMVGVHYYVSKTRRHQGKPDRTFYISYKLDGKRKWEKVGRRSEKVTAAYASQIRGERLRQARHGDLPSSITGNDITFDEAWQRFKSTHLVLSKNPATAIGQDLNYKKHLKDRFGNVHLSKITPLVLDELKGELLRDYAPQTVTHILGQIRQVYNKCIDWGLWHGEVPTRNIKMPRSDNSRVRFLSVNDADKLLANIKKRSPQTYKITLLSLHTGMRASEIFGLRGEHIDVLSGQIRLSETKNYRGRVVYLTEEAKTELKMLHLKPGALVFPSRTGGKIKRISRAFPRAVEQLKFNDNITETRDKVVFHSLRHTFASWLAIEGVPLYVISQQLGHKSLEMTKRYAHLCPDVHLQAVGKLEAMISNQRSSSRSDQAKP